MNGCSCSFMSSSSTIITIVCVEGGGEKIVKRRATISFPLYFFWNSKRGLVSVHYVIMKIIASCYETKAAKLYKKEQCIHSLQSHNYITQLNCSLLHYYTYTANTVPLPTFLGVTITLAIIVVILLIIITILTIYICCKGGSSGMW